MAWAHSDVEAWSELDHLMAYDRVPVASEVGRSLLATTSAGRLDVLCNAADTELFAPREGDGGRDGVASPGVYVERGRAIQPLINDVKFTVPLTVYAEPQRNMRSSLLGRLEEPIAWLRAPEVMTRSELTVIELPSTAVGDATLPAHFFESIACGSLPIVNSRLGAVECGLEVPSYTTSDELGELITSLRADPERIHSLVEGLRERGRARAHVGPAGAHLRGTCRHGSSGSRRRPRRSGRCTTSRTTTGRTPTGGCCSRSSGRWMPTRRPWPTSSSTRRTAPSRRSRAS
ncbi:glycosyltransferase [Nocardioides sp. B-3]|uniref:glycosyltransferase n=1 Tax=Nocardioides sp. B-3 TaxID=2895565 RepID=UPI0021525481|nr:glycosyltransferase [Nocardioides sp. B-3]UUZ59825.1 glycosyltransferase [Nocardioides sp. B-3]